MFSCVHMCVPVCRGSQRPTTGSLPSLHLTFQHSISHWSWLELTSLLGGLDSKLPRSSCLCLRDAPVLEKPMHSDPFFPPSMPLSLWELCVRVWCALIMLPMPTAPSLPHPLYHFLPTSSVWFLFCCCCCPKSTNCICRGPSTCTQVAAQRSHLWRKLIFPLPSCHELLIVPQLKVGCGAHHPAPYLDLSSFKLPGICTCHHKLCEFVSALGGTGSFYLHGLWTPSPLAYSLLTEPPSQS